MATRQVLTLVMHGVCATGFDRCFMPLLGFYWKTKISYQSHIGHVHKWRAHKEFISLYQRQLNLTLKWRELPKRTKTHFFNLNTGTSLTNGPRLTREPSTATVFQCRTSCWALSWRNRRPGASSSACRAAETFGHLRWSHAFPIEYWCLYGTGKRKWWN